MWRVVTRPAALSLSMCVIIDGLCAPDAIVRDQDPQRRRRRRQSFFLISFFLFLSISKCIFLSTYLFRNIKLLCECVTADRATATVTATLPGVTQSLHFTPQLVWRFTTTTTACDDYVLHCTAQVNQTLLLCSPLQSVVLLFLCFFITQSADGVARIV